jgi:hypothetical protein
MDIIQTKDGGYLIPGFGVVMPDADGEAGQRLAEVLRRIAEGIDTLVPYVPPPPPTAQERRAAKYRALLDEQYTIPTMRYMSLLSVIPDDPEHALRRQVIMAKLTAARAKILEITDAIELEIKD